MSNVPILETSHALTWKPRKSSQINNFVAIANESFVSRFGSKKYVTRWGTTIDVLLGVNNEFRIECATVRHKSVLRTIRDDSARLREFVGDSCLVKRFCRRGHTVCSADTAMAVWPIQHCTTTMKVLLFALQWNCLS
ncbi:hypothetical protein BIW11_03112 [Tropilaelaps mercedesae]|uniref:Uncharacterized protein n=1 Tax=Tropilaelaps mercedesae TaxID=418985 RepID=A0A1V9XRX5_9ACAR|nr:hypothetical protein BIW11_03112 [Tropilaelaps mercedesae]